MKKTRPSVKGKRKEEKEEDQCERKKKKQRRRRPKLTEPSGKKKCQKLWLTFDYWIPQYVFNYQNVIGN